MRSTRDEDDDGPVPLNNAADATRDTTESAASDAWQAVRDAAGDSADIVRLRWMRIVGSVRAFTFAVAIAIFASIVAAMCVAAGGIWATIRTLSDLRAALGGGLLGSALTAMAFVLMVVFGVWLLRALRRRAFLKRCRRAVAMNPNRRNPPASPELVALAELERRKRSDLIHDAERVLGAGNEILREHPLSALVVSASSGFLSTTAWTRLGSSLATNTRSRGRRWGRRVTVAALRLARTLGIASTVEQILAQMSHSGASEAARSTAGRDGVDPHGTTPRPAGMSEVRSR
ncbi:MAG: hypothetical protein KDC95_15540 [Planctomycetes bacterium]|nr:hypothetical protein [Planctomycetota bacterium]